MKPTPARLCSALAVLLLSLSVGAYPGATAPQPTQNGSLEFVARATPTGGRAELVQQFSFYLLRKSFADIRKEAEAETPPPDLDRFMDSLEVSPELKAWMKRTRSVQLNGQEFMRRLKTADIMDVPEFFEAYLARNAVDVAVGFPKPKYREADRERNPAKYEKQRQEYREQVRKYMESYTHTRDGIDLHLLSVDPAQRWAGKEAERNGDVRRRTLELANTKYLAGRAETDLEGRATFAGLSPGDYWLSSLENEAVTGDVRLRWDAPVTLRAGQTTRIELSNINAALPARNTK